MERPDRDRRSRARVPATPRPTASRSAVLLLAAPAIAAVLLVGCRSGPPKTRTVLFVRTDLDFMDVWEATRTVLDQEFAPGETDLGQRTVRSGPRYDDLDASLRWWARARIDELERNLAVRVTVFAERLTGSGWKRIGRDDRTAQWLTRRIDTRVRLDKGPAPPDYRLEPPPPDPVPAAPLRDFNEPPRLPDDPRATPPHGRS